MEEIQVQVVLKPKGGRKQVLKGNIAIAALEAIENITMDKQKTVPKNFSLAETIAMAIALGHKTKEEITDYIERHIQRCRIS